MSFLIKGETTIPGTATHVGYLRWQASPLVFVTDPAQAARYSKEDAEAVATWTQRQVSSPTNKFTLEESKLPISAERPKRAAPVKTSNALAKAADEEAVGVKKKKEVPPCPALMKALDTLLPVEVKTIPNVVAPSAPVSNATTKNLW